jgi:hypothetical protein
MSHRRTLLHAVLVCALSAAACMTWSNVDVPVTPAPMRTYPGLTRVTTPAYGSIELHSVVTISDSLFGLDEQRRVSYPLQSVSKIEQRVKSPGRTLIALGLGLVALGFTGVMGVGFK